ncbi:MAG: response regulator transcription factor [Bacteroidales bacterium]|jgi:DNA-binding response OmpR family regulator|nr:response regulator transcription factor [Bacteroidales bacterium]MBR4584883.1 response regulator transcription factor [Bacteroidales bacterium]
MSKEKLLLVEDDVNFGFVLKSYLEMNDFYVTLITDGKDAVNAFLSREYNLCILDVMLPNVDGFTIAKEIKRISPSCPVIFLTARSLKEDIMEGFRIGADDYLTKPFESDVLLMKIRAILRRNFDIKPGISDVVTIGKYKFNTKIRSLTSTDEEHRLTPREADLLKALYINKNNVLDRNEALKKIWGDDNYFNARSMDVYITKLRKYFKNDDSVQIDNIHGSGFILVVKE